MKMKEARTDVTSFCTCQANLFVQICFCLETSDLINPIPCKHRDEALELLEMFRLQESEAILPKTIFLVFPQMWKAY